MNMLKKSIALFIVIVLVMAAIPAVMAADCEPGNTVTVYLNLGTGYGIDGNITVNDPDGIISKVAFSGPSEYDGFVETDGNGYYTYFSKINVSSIGDCLIIARVTLKNDKALVGKTATISFTGTTSQSDNGGFVDVAISKSATVTMIQPKPVVKIDYSELKKQIGIAEGLTKGDYTADSWSALETALANAKKHLTSQSQSAVDKAAADLAAAIAALVKMDYSKLEEAIKDANELIDSDELGKLWKDMLDALLNGTGLLGSGDQEAVDAAADELLKLIDLLKKALAESGECPGECEHIGPFCNITWHKIWPILLIISLTGKAVLIVILAVKKKKDEE